MLRPFRLTARRALTGALGTILFAGMLVAPVEAAEDPSGGYLDRAISLSSQWRDGASFESVSQPGMTTFTASSGPHAGEAVDSLSWNVSDSDGAYTVIVLLYEQPWISAFQGDATGTFVGGSWELASADPNAPVTQGVNETVVVDNTLACAVGVGAGGGAVGTIACLPLTPVGQAICGAIGGAVGGAIGYVICQDVTRGEGVLVDLTCFQVDRCKIGLTVRSYNNRADSVQVDIFWDLKGQTGGPGAIPCRPACGDHSISTHSNTGAQYVSTTYVVDPDDPTRNRPLYEYKFNFTAVGTPACFVDNTIAVWAFFRVGLANTTRDLFADNGRTKNSSYCPGPY